jgi:hypothetical protein
MFRYEVSGRLVRGRSGTPTTALQELNPRNFSIFQRYPRICGARGGAVGRGTVLQAGTLRVRFPMVSLEFFIDIILPALGLTQPLTYISKRNTSWGGGGG